MVTVGRPTPHQGNPYLSLRVVSLVSAVCCWDEMPSCKFSMISFCGLAAGNGGVVVIKGEPGSGKTSLLDHFVSSLAEDVSVLRCVGVESEAHLAYAGLAGLFRPILEYVPLLPPMQRAALASALALEGVEQGGDQLAVAAGGLGAPGGRGRRGSDGGGDR